MKLYLSSYRISTPNDFFDLIGKEPSDIDMAIIPNAKDYRDEESRKVKIDDYVRYMGDLGIRATVVDLRDFNDPVELKNTLGQYDAIWATGGNTFCLRYEMKRSGFDQIAKELLDQGVVYAGDSAGAIVAGNSLRGIEFADEPSLAREVIWEGMKLTDKFILPHTDSPDFSEAMKRAKTVHRDDQTLVEMTDSQALVVNNEVVYLATSKAI